MIRPLSSYITNQELCDDLHALLHQSIGYHQIGDYDMQRQLLSDCFKIGKKYKVFHPDNFNHNNQLSIDDLVSLLSISTPQLNEYEITERFSLYCYIFQIDTYCSMSEGEGFVIDHSQYPNIAPFNNPKVNIVEFQSIRKSEHHLWDKEWKPIFDLIKETTCLIPQYLPDAVYKAKNQMQLMKSYRTIIDFSRRKKYEQLESDGQVRREYHLFLLNSMSSIQQDFAIINSLVPFVYGQLPVVKQPTNLQNIRDNYMKLCGILVGFCYTHLSGVLNHDATFYSLELNGIEMFSNLDIFLAVFNAVVYMIQFADFVESPLPNPLFGNVMMAYFIQCIASSTIYAINNSVVDPSIKDNVTNGCFVVLKMLGKIGTIWPLANQYRAGLEKMLSTFQ
ncbi:hypothetical protein HK103_002411 [Boothiomyces macroporosus]|uniref:Uncharacterized protein n=1 Tax=Boothiomyces macroporosus TaxID=261099 RepID=A0AAD5U9R5_9FUNG|nr:hypothetical protein HK103_002411 [Boothiomyces macroporosus]